jgi:hypothetical protein
MSKAFVLASFSYGGIPFSSSVTYAPGTLGAALKATQQSVAQKVDESAFNTLSVSHNALLVSFNNLVNTLTTNGTLTTGQAPATPVTWRITVDTPTATEGDTRTWVITRTGTAIVGTETLDIESVGMQREDFVLDKDVAFANVATATTGVTYSTSPTRRFTFGPTWSGILIINRTFVSDDLAEVGESVALQISNPSNGSIVGNAAPSVTVSDPVITPPANNSIDDYVASSWAAAQGWSVPYQLPGKDYPIGPASLNNLKVPGGAGMSVNGNIVSITQVGIYDGFDFRGKQVFLNFLNTNPDAVVIQNSVFNNAVPTETNYVAQDWTNGPRADCTLRNNRFEGTGNNTAGGGTYIFNLGICYMYHNEFTGGAQDPVQVCGGSFEENLVEAWGAADGVHFDVVNLDQPSQAPFKMRRNLIDASVAKFPNIQGGFNSLIKTSPGQSSTGPTMDLLFEENVAWFSGFNQNNGNLYWFQNQGSQPSGSQRFLRNYLGKLLLTNGDGTHLFGAGVLPYVASQDNKRLQENNARWLQGGVNSDNDAGIALPSIPSIALALTTSSSVTPTFSLGANTTYVEGEWRVIGTSRWLPTNYPATITSGTAITGTGSTYEFRFRGVRNISGRKFTGDWTSKLTAA